jgi:hypothetical protein
VFPQEGHARIAEKKVVLSMVQQKVEKLKSSLEHICNIKGDIGEVLKVAEEQLEMRNKRRIICQQASVLLHFLDLFIFPVSQYCIYFSPFSDFTFSFSSGH